MHPTVWLHGHGLQHVVEALSAHSVQRGVPYAGIPCTVFADMSLAQAGILHSRR
jgi:hypothetical protein